LLRALDIGEQTVSLAGGLILFLIAIRMIFPKRNEPRPSIEKGEPFIFPIAIPMIAGPSILTTIMLYSYQKHDSTKIIMGILIAWAFSITVLLFAQNIKNIVGQRALIAIERLMGLLLTMMAVEMLLLGLKNLIRNDIS
jgi:multiple antibiotic resistance protein